MNPLRRARVTRGLSQAELAERVGIAQALVSKLERSERSRARPDMEGATAEHAAILARFFGHAVSEMEILYPTDYLNVETTTAD